MSRVSQRDELFPCRASVIFHSHDVQRQGLARAPLDVAAKQLHLIFANFPSP
jgi:hypothetical protein